MKQIEWSPIINGFKSPCILAVIIYYFLGGTVILEVSYWLKNIYLSLLFD
jgi:hypothetical protein